MTTPQANTPRRARPWHLLWIAPLGLAITWVASIWMTLSWCGISGCSGGGFGRISNPSLPGVLIGAAVIALTWLALLSAPRWRLGVRSRVITGLVVGLVVALLASSSATDGFIR